MKQFFAVLSIILVSQLAFGQSDDDALSPVSIEQPAQFEGGISAFYKYIGMNLRYPPQARVNRIVGKVYVQFVIDKDGSIPDEEVIVLKSVHKSLDNEVIRLIKECPDWIPAQHEGQKVKQRMVVPVIFELGNPDIKKTEKKKKKDKKRKKDAAEDKVKQ